METYDPNIREAKQTVRIKLMQWNYTATHEVTIGGNSLGFGIFEPALNRLYEQLLGGADIAEVELSNPDGKILSCEDDEEQEEIWLGKMVVGIEIINRKEGGA